MTNTAHLKAWMAIAEAYATPSRKRTPAERYIASLGLCRAAQSVGMNFYRIDILNGVRDKFWWPFNMEHDQCRALSAMLIAHMGEEEFRLLRKTV